MDSRSVYIQELATIGEQVKSLCLDPKQAVDETVRRVALVLDELLGHNSKVEMLTIREVAKLLGCSYGEARNRMLEGRIKSVKEGRWHRTRREWVEQYIEQRLIYTDPSTVQIPFTKQVLKKRIGIRPNSIALQFLRERKK